MYTQFIFVEPSGFSLFMVLLFTTANVAHVVIILLLQKTRLVLILLMRNPNEIAGI